MAQREKERKREREKERKREREKERKREREKERKREREKERKRDREKERKRFPKLVVISKKQFFVRSNLFRKLSEPVVKFPILRDRVSKGEFLFFC